MGPEITLPGGIAGPAAFDQTRSRFNSRIASEGRGACEMSEDTPAAESSRTLGGLARRWILFVVLMGTLFFVTTTLGAVWSPLAWLVPGAAAIVLVILVVRGVMGRT